MLKKQRSCADITSVKRILFFIREQVYNMYIEEKKEEYLMRYKGIISAVSAASITLASFHTASAYTAINTPSISVQNCAVEGDVNIYLMMLNMYFEDMSYSFDMSMLETMDLKQAYRKMKQQMQEKQLFYKNLEKYDLKDRSFEELKERYHSELISAGKRTAQVYSLRSGLHDCIADILSDTECIALQTQVNEASCPGQSFRESPSVLIERAALYAYLEYKAEHEDLDFSSCILSSPSKIIRRINVPKRYYETYSFTVCGASDSKKGLTVKVAGTSEYDVLLHTENIAAKFIKHANYIQRWAVLIDPEADDVFEKIAENKMSLRYAGINANYIDKLLAYHYVEEKIASADDGEITLETMQELLISLLDDIAASKI